MGSDARYRFGLLLEGAWAYAHVDTFDGIDLSMDDAGNVSFQHRIRIPR